MYTLVQYFPDENLNRDNRFMIMIKEIKIIKEVIPIAYRKVCRRFFLKYFTGTLYLFYKIL